MVDIEISPLVESWKIANLTNVDFGLADVPGLNSLTSLPKMKNGVPQWIEALDYTTQEILGVSVNFRNAIIQSPPLIATEGYKHTHHGLYDATTAGIDLPDATNWHSHNGLDILTGGSSSNADLLHTHNKFVTVMDINTIIDDRIAITVPGINLNAYVKVDGSINQLSDITSTGSQIEMAVTQTHAQDHTLLEHTDAADPFTIINLRKLFDGSNADCLHVHSYGGGTSIHNDLTGLNEGDYLHLTALDYGDFTELIDGSNADALHTHSGLGVDHNDLDGLQGGSTSHPSITSEYYHLIYDEYNQLTNTLNADNLHFHNATAIVYDNTTYPTVDDALAYLLYVTPNILTFTNNISAVEIGSTVISTILTWTIDEDADLTSQSLNQGIGEVTPLTARNYTHTDSYTVNRTYTLTITDGVNPDAANTTVYFRHKKYWGTNSNTSLNDAQIIALSSELSTSISMSKTIVSSGTYIYFAWPSSWDSSPPATFTVNGLNNTAWTYVTRNFINASGYTEEFRIYKSDNLLTGSYDIVVS